MFVPSLKEKISELLATQIVFAADAIFGQYRLGHLKSLDDVYITIQSAIISTLRGPLETLPSELVQSLAQRVEKVESFSIVPILTLMSSSCDQLNFLSSRCPPEIAWFCMRRMAAGVKKIRFNFVMGDDKLLLALAESPAAATLRKIDLYYNSGTITDASSGAWRNFPSLEAVLVDSDPLTSITLDEILALPKLRKLSFASVHVSGRRVIEKAIENNVALDNLVVDLTGNDIAEETRHVIDLLAKNPKFSTNLRNIEFSKYSKFDGTECQEMKDALFAACPNLETIPLIFPLEQTRLPDAQPRFTLLRCDYNEAAVSQVDIDRLASKCPELKALYLENAYLQANDLRKLSALTELELHLSSPVPADITFPSQLTLLGLISEEGLPKHSDFDDLLLRIGASLPDMKELYIKVPNIMEKSTYLKLLGSMMALTDLRIMNTASDNSNSGAEIVQPSHATLVSIPRVEGMKFSSTFSNLPEVDYLHVDSSWNDIKLDSSLSLRLPGIRTLNIDHKYWDLSFASRFKLLQSVELSGGAEDNLPVTLSELSSVQLVNLRDYHTTEPFCADLVERMTRLQSLSIRQQDELAPQQRNVSLVRSIDWIKRSLLLQYLSLENLGAFLEPGQLESICLSGDQLPFLTQVEINFAQSNVLPPAITVEGLPNLRVLRLTTQFKEEGEIHAAAVDIAVSHCPSLCDLLFLCLGLHSLAVADVPLLDTLGIFQCHIMCPSQDLLKDNFQFSELPSLIQLTMRAFPVESPEPDLLDGVRDLIRARAPQLPQSGDAGGF